MFTMCETQMNKNVTPVAHRIKAKQDGRPFLRRNEQSSDVGNDVKDEQQTFGAGLQKMGDLEEVFENSNQSENSNEQSDSRTDNVNHLMTIGDDDE